MKRALAALTVAVFAMAQPAAAALKVGAKAPDFQTQGSLAGKPFSFQLSAALKKGPVVLYFFPAAFTSGCTIEAHEFAEISDEVTALGGTLIGVTAGNIDRIQAFSVSECRNKFAVTADADLAIAKRYDSTLVFRPGWSNRTSYLIAPNGEIVWVLSDMNAEGHASGSLTALKAWKARASK